MPASLESVDHTDWSFRKKSSSKDLGKDLSIRDELSHRLDELDSKQYNLASKKKQKMIRASAMCEKLKRFGFK